MKYLLTPHAREDLHEAAAYYDAQRPGLGAEFALDVGVTIAKILDAPRQWPEEEPGVRRCTLDRFPYGVYYRIASARLVHVMAVFDLRRRPGSWRR